VWGHTLTRPFFIARKEGLEMSGAIAMAKTDAQYEIENDARILVDAEVIKQDSKRFEKAIAQIKKENAARTNAVKK